MKWFLKILTKVEKNVKIRDRKMRYTKNSNKCQVQNAKCARHSVLGTTFYALFFCVALNLFQGLFLVNGQNLNYHGCALAPDGLHGWVVTIDTPTVFHTWNGGLNWEEQQIFTIRDFFDVFFLDSLKGWVCGRLAFIWHTEDGGVNWTTQNFGFGKFATRLFFLNDSFGWAACGLPIILRTTDGGANWEQIIIGFLPTDTVDFYGVSFVNNLKGWICAGRYPEYDTATRETSFTKGQGFILTSDNGGVDWTLLLRDTIYDFFDIEFADSLEGWVAGGDDQSNSGVIFRTTDGGLNWQTQTIPSEAKYLRALEFVDQNHGWAVGRNGTIIKTSNGGNTWVLQNSGVDTTLFDVDFTDSLRGLIAGNSVVLYTTNGGVNWLRANVTGIVENSKSEARSPKLLVAPNPFTGSTVLRLPSTVRRPPSAVHRPPFSAILIYDINGRLVKSFSAVDGKRITEHGIIWDGKDERGILVKPGVYFAVLFLNETIKTSPWGAQIRRGEFLKIVKIE